MQETPNVTIINNRGFLWFFSALPLPLEFSKTAVIFEFWQVRRKIWSIRRKKRQKFYPLL